jgi:hypothetical protein
MQWVTSMTTWFNQYLGMAQERLLTWMVMNKQRQTIHQMFVATKRLNNGPQ